MKFGVVFFRFQLYSFRISMCPYVPSLEDDLLTILIGLFVGICCKKCVKNKEKMRDHIFLLRVFSGIVSVDVLEFIYVAEVNTLKENISMIMILTFFCLELIYLVIITICNFFSHIKIFTVGFVFTFKVLSFSIAAVIFNSTTANYNMGYYKELYYNVTNWEEGSHVSVATVSVFTMGFNFLELIGKIIYIVFIYCTTSKSLQVIFCSAAAKSEHEPEDTIQDTLDHI